jgi:RNA polymerase sigma-70 factor (ECF subfamily)
MTSQQPASNQGPARKLTPSQEKRLIEGASRGDEQALTELYQLHVTAVYHYVNARLSDTATAEDITSDVFVRAIEMLDQFEQRGIPFLGWLYRIAHGKVIDHYRRMQHRADHLDVDDAVIVANENPEQAASDHLFLEYVLEHLHQLNATHQQVLILRFLQGHSIRATARLMGKSEGAIRSLQFRAVQALAQSLDLDRGES